MKLLVIGGTRFVGRHFVEAAQARGHAITLFHRGESGADLFPDLETIHGDRETDLGRLAGRRWDAVVDTCGYVPRVVRLSTEALRDQVDHYVFISTISVYADPINAGADEDALLQTLADPTVETITGETYGGLKALCEQAAEAAMPGRVLHVRPGMIVGPHDMTDRFTYWVARAARGGEMLVPASPDRPVQMIDARDLARWLVPALENRLTSVYNTTGPAAPITWADWMAVCAEAAGTQPVLRYVDDDFVRQHAPDDSLPFYTPEPDSGIFALSVQRAINAGLTFRPLVETARDTLAWHRTRGADTVLRAGLTPEREAALLDLYRNFIAEI